MVSTEYQCAGVSATADSEPRFLLTNGIGDFFALGYPNVSNYDGYFVKRSDVYTKILQDISFESSPSSILLDGYCVERNNPETKQRFELMDNGLLFTGDGVFRLTLDIKRLYDESDVGRVYSVDIRAAPESAPQGSLMNISTADICYTKYNDPSLSSVAYKVFACVATTMRVERSGTWREGSYPYDVRRGTHSTPWVYDALLLRGIGDCVISDGETLDEARRKAVDLLVRKEMYVSKHRSVIAGLTPALSPHALIAWRSLHALTTESGIMAGLPWFFHEWSRDELISCGGFIAVRDYQRVIAILDKWYSAVRDDGALPAIYPDKGLSSSDAPGWLGKRTRDLLLKLSDERIIHQIPAETIIRWREVTGKMLDGYASRMRHGLIHSEYNTTWMDTSSNDDGRAGCRIEIQALYLALYDAHAHLCVLTKTPIIEHRRASAEGVFRLVRERLVRVEDVTTWLLDGLHDDGREDLAVRPNIFLAWYIAPKLFSATEWNSFFRSVMPKLWLSWGGLSSISTDDKNFHASYTGEDVASYHRGDSWYFINNVAAMALLDTDPDARHYVDRIVAASVADMLAQGYTGHCSEVSSASRQEACGCHAQAWSASTLLELLMRL